MMSALLIGLTFCLLAQGQNRGNASIPAKVKEELNLSADDFAQLEASYKTYREEVQAARKASNGSDRSKISEVRTSYIESVKNMNVLSASQLETYTKFLNQRRGGRNTDALKAKLEMTEEQIKKFDAANKAYSQMAGKLRGEYEGDRTAFMEAIKPLREKRAEMMASFLSEEQMTIYKEETENAGGHHH